ncbi:MAG: preprotein translocase subunit SecE [Dehalococcoidia bacterium]|nr:preprotein translocase subunit SecE [Dehalococcoidia bacterium]
MLAKSQSKSPAQQQASAGRRRGFLPSFASDVVAELRRVVWPSRHETFNLTVVVIIVAIVVGLLLGGIDIFFERIVEELLL